MTAVDLILIMSVNPGFGGQSFIESQVKKIADLRKLCAEKVMAPSLKRRSFKEGLLHDINYDYDIKYLGFSNNYGDNCKEYY